MSATCTAPVPPSRTYVVEDGEPKGRHAKVAVLLAAYNGRAWIVEQVRSILDQAGVDVRLFVSVDRSSDGTETIIARLAQEDARVVLLPYGERYGGAGANFVRLFRDVDFAGFDYVALADQDDIWFEDKLLRAYRCLTACNAAAYSCNVLAFWPSGRKLLVNKAQPQQSWDFLFEAAGPGCTYVLVRDIACQFQRLVKARGVEVGEVGLHDWLIYAFVRARGEAWVIDPAAGMLYRQHEHNQVGVNAGLRAFWSRIKKVLNGWAFEQTRLIARLVDADANVSVRRWLYGGRSGFLLLAMNAPHCRRRVRDRVWFFTACLLAAVTGGRS